MGRLYPAGYQHTDGTEATPVVLGSLTFSVSGSATAKAVYSDASLATSSGSTVNLDSEGRTVSEVFGTGNYRVKLWSGLNGTGTTHWTKDDVRPSGDIDYPVSAAETSAGIAASVTAGNYNYGDIRRYGAISGAADVTSAFAAAELVASSHENYWPAGTWNLSGVKLTTGAKVTTDGFSTSLVQLAGYDGAPNTLTRLVKIIGSDVILGDLSVTGQIATDSGEFNHGVTVETEGADITNVTIGDIKGTNIRGDVLYIGGLLTNTVSNIRYGRITGSNILRNIVSVTTNARAISGISIEQTGALGYATYDIEPDVGSPFDIHVGIVRGRRVQCAPADAADYADRISIGSMDLDPSYGGNSTPAYSAYEGDDGLVLRNTRHIYIGQARIKNFPCFAIEHIFNIGELADQRLHIGHLDVSGCGASESTYFTPCLLLNMSHVQVDSGVIALQDTAADYGFYGNATTGTSFDLSSIVCDGALVREADASTFKNIRISTAAATRAFQNVTNSTVQDSNITIPTLLTTGANVSFRNVDGTHSTAVLAGTCTDITFDNCSGGLVETQTPTQWVANTNNFALLDGTNILRPSTDASRDLTGMAGGRAGRRLQLFNVGSFDLVLKNDVTSTAANRFLLGADLTIGTNEGVVLWYDTTSSRWRCASRI